MLRASKSYSQEGFADGCGIDRSYMGGIERGRRNPSTVNLLRIIDALGMKPSEFFKHLEKAAKPQP
jgi:transcriptional regulator with XRE-family HTH domain